MIVHEAKNKICSRKRTKSVLKGAILKEVRLVLAQVDESKNSE